MNALICIPLLTADWWKVCLKGWISLWERGLYNLFFLTVGKPLKQSWTWVRVCESADWTLGLGQHLKNIFLFRTAAGKGDVTQKFLSGMFVLFTEKASFLTVWMWHGLWVCQAAISRSLKEERGAVDDSYRSSIIMTQRESVTLQELLKLVNQGNSCEVK